MHRQVSFGQGLAFASRKRGFRVVVFAALAANPPKIVRMRDLGAEVRLFASDFDEAKNEARRFAEISGARFIEDGRETQIAEGAAGPITSFSLSPKPHRLFDIALGARFKRDKFGKMLIWESIPALTGLTTDAGMPGGEKVFRVSQGRLVDTTLEFCPQILSPNDADYAENQRALTPENISKLVSGSEPDDDTSSALLSLAYRLPSAGSSTRHSII